MFIVFLYFWGFLFFNEWNVSVLSVDWAFSSASVSAYGEMSSCYLIIYGLISFTPEIDFVLQTLYIFYDFAVVQIFKFVKNFLLLLLSIIWNLKFLELTFWSIYMYIWYISICINWEYLKIKLFSWCNTITKLYL